MNITVLIILAVVVLVFIELALRFGIFRLVNKAGNAVDKKIVNYQKENRPSEPIRLADLYPDLAESIRNGKPILPVQSTPPTPQQSTAGPGTGTKILHRLMTTDNVESVDTPVVNVPVPSEPVQNQSASPEPFPLTRCCLCGGELRTGYAVFFTNDQGEARLDENCCNGIAQLARSNDVNEILQAGNYFTGLKPQVQPAVAEYLQQYLSAAEQYLQMIS